MMHSHFGDVENLPERNLTRRNWFALLALSSATACILVFGVEFVARQMYYESETTTFPCLVVNDPTTGVRGVPNSTCSQKIFESRLTQYALNNCGHRAGMECRPKPVGVQRIVLVGSSVAYGMWVPQEGSFAALLPVELSRRTGRKIELYNESMQWGTPHSVDLRFKEVLAAKPDVVLWTLTPFDIENVGLTLPYVPVAKEAGTAAPNAGGGATIWHRAAVAFSKKPISDVIHDGWGRFVEALDQTRTVFLLQHLMYQSPSLYVKHFLMQGESAAFLRTEPDAAWKGQLMQLDTYAADLERQTKSIGATLVVTLLPQRAQAAMISDGEWPAGFDPYKVGEDVRSIIERHGGTYIDVLHGFQNVPNAASYYFPVDGHVDLNGHKLLSGLLTDALVSNHALSPGTIPDERSTVTGNE
jgi:hypothetical protein